MCIFFKFDHLRIKLQSSDFFRGTKFHALLFLSLHSSSSTFKLLSMTSYGGELLLDSSSTWSDISIHLYPSPFHCNQTSRSKGIHWWKRSKAYKLHMELHHVVSRASSSRWCSFASSMFLFGQFTLIPFSSYYSPCISSIVLWFGAV